MLAITAAAIGSTLTLLMLAFKIFQVVVARTVVQGAPPPFDGVETTIGLIALIAFAPILAEVLLGHIAIATSQRTDTRTRVLAVGGTALGYFYLVSLALNVLMAAVDNSFASASFHETLLKELFYSLG
jgi:heme A synthase